MKMKQTGSLRRSAQAGFTLIELIVVIVILGVLAATALPKFANVGSDARIAKMNAARAAVQSGAAMYHGRWLAAGSPATETNGVALTVDGVAINGTGYPTNAGIIVAAGGLSDYDTATTAGTIAESTSRPSCKIEYTASSGAVTAPPASSTGSCD